MCICVIHVFVACEGEFGTVFRGMWKEQPKKQVPIAVKTLKVSTFGIFTVYSLWIKPVVVVWFGGKVCMTSDWDVLHTSHSFFALCNVCTLLCVSTMKMFCGQVWPESSLVNANGAPLPFTAWI